MAGPRFRVPAFKQHELNAVSDTFAVMDSLRQRQIPGRKCNAVLRNRCDCTTQRMKTSVVILALLSTTVAMARQDGQFTPVMEDTGFCSKIIEPYILYNCTEYTVTTFDGFLLSIQLIELMDYAGSQFLGDVLFLHPSVLGGSSWFLASSPTPLAVADAGYSVWIGHTRATEFSFGHEQLNPTQQEFWNWDMDELANYDFPSFVDFVFSTTNGRKFHFIGYSQGARVGLGSISYQWNRAAKLNSVILLAPLMYMTNTQSRVLLALNYTDIAELGYHIGVGKLSFAALSGITEPRDSEGLEAMQREFLCQVTGPNCCINPHTAYKAFTGPYAVTTYKNLAHITQSMRDQTFMAYDFGTLNSNTEVYQSQVPPKYKLAEVPNTIPIFVLYGGNDRLSTPTDIEYMISELSRQPEVLNLPLYAHLDFLLSNAMMEDVNLPILNFIGSHNW